MNTLTLLLTVFTQRNFVASSSKVRFQIKYGRFAFLNPLGGLGATYDVHLRLIEKRVVDVLLVLIDLLLYSFNVMFQC